jgi:hypothetical protein
MKRFFSAAVSLPMPAAMDASTAVPPYRSPPERQFHPGIRVTHSGAGGILQDLRDYSTRLTLKHFLCIFA